MNSTISLENFKVSVFISNKFIYLYVYNKTYYSLFKISLKINMKLKNNKTIEFKNTKACTLTKQLSFFLKQLFFYEFVKIKFTGKGYKIKKNTKKSLILLFNRAHTTTLWWRNIFVKKLKKYKLYIKCNNFQNSIVNTILFVRKINIFTKKGLRKSRQILFKKKGKK